jgi:hypothetical protein
MKTLHIYPTGVGYHITIVIVLAFLFGMSVSNSIYFSKVSNTPNISVNKGTLSNLSGLNIVLALFSGLSLVWSLYRIVSSHESKHKTLHDEYVRLTQSGDLDTVYKSNNPTIHRQQHSYSKTMRPDLPDIF